jgi:LysR family transcriptional regulator, hydrogen peroxide-inducible genes activator
MEMHQIRYFLAVARERNFSRAAETCNITQPALTRAIQKLEEEVGGKLFDRRPGPIELTELGRTLQPKLESAFRDVAEAARQAREHARHRKQRLRLGVMCTIGPERMIGFIEHLHLANPGLEFQLTEAKGSAVVAALVNDEIDIGLAGLPNYPEGLAAEELYRERYVLAVPACHRFASANAVPLSELDGEDYIERLNCEFDDFFEAAYGQWPVELNLRYRSEREDWVQAMIRSGLGIAIVPESMPLAPGVATTTLVTPEIVRTVSLITRRDRELPPLAQAFVRAVRAHDWAV